MFSISKMIPCILVEGLEPGSALRITGQFVSFRQRYQGLYVYPPKFLIPLQLLGGVSVSIQKIKDAAILRIPALF